MRIAPRLAATAGGLTLAVGGVLVLGGAPTAVAASTAVAAATFDECVTSVSPNAQDTEKEAPGSGLVEAGCESGTEGGARALKECAGLLESAGVTPKTATDACRRAARD
ncbi:hypothetical protein ACFRR7_21220 [Streptomyces sp. NPDC056909]|uniref:hypothetical protein n=1 Tax=Streptomyces sp. NPDC056909 TaxID=3345963 RepID=UPI0036BCDA99